MANIRQEIIKTIDNAASYSPEDGVTCWYELARSNGNIWAFVCSWIDYDGTGDYRLYGKIAKCPENSPMKDYDYDWLMSYDDNGDVLDTELEIDPYGDIDYDLDWWINQWNLTQEEEEELSDDSIESTTDVSNPYAESYYAIMNMLDNMILNNQPLTTRDLYRLQDMASAEGHTIEDIADANDCGECHTWQDLYNALKALHKSGERVSVTTTDSVESAEKVECVGHSDPGQYFDLIDYFDVWGNEEDGWEVNNLGPIEEKIWISDDITEEELFNYLKDTIGYFNKDTKFSDVIIEWNDPDFIEFFQADNYYPLGRLQKSYTK